MIAGMVRRLLEQKTFEAATQTILDDVIALFGAEYGNIQLSVGEELVLVAQRRLSAKFLMTFRRVFRYDGTACGRALNSGKIVHISDVEKDPGFAAYRLDAREAGFRAVQSAPLSSDDGLIGVVSAHFANPHSVSKLEAEMFEAYRPIAARHLRELLGNVPLALKAEEMSEQLYGNISDQVIHSRKVAV